MEQTKVDFSSKPNGGLLPDDKPSSAVVCARVCLKTILVHFGHNATVDSLLERMGDGRILPVDAIAHGMEIHLALARDVRPHPHRAFAVVNSVKSSNKTIHLSHGKTEKS